MFCGPDWTKGGPHENEFWHFSNIKINITNRAQKVDKKNEVICLVYFSLPELWSLNCPEQCIFFKFVLTSARNTNLPKQFIYIQLKDLVMLFQKIVWFLGVWAIVHEILRNKIFKKMLIQQKFNEIHQLEALLLYTFHFDV